MLEPQGILGIDLTDPNPCIPMSFDGSGRLNSGKDLMKSYPNSSDSHICIYDEFDNGLEGVERCSMDMLEKI